MKTFYLFRHGDTFATLHRVPYGDKILTAPILEESFEYIDKMGEYLKDTHIDFFAASPIIRCQQTAERICNIIKVPFATDDRLTEFDQDSLLTPEPISTFIERMKNFLTDMDKSENENIAICTHGSGTAALMHLIKNGQIEGDDLLHFPSPGQIWIVNKKRWETKDFR